MLLGCDNRLQNVGKFGKNLTEIFKILVKWSAMF